MRRSTAAAGDDTVLLAGSALDWSASDAGGGVTEYSNGTVTLAISNVEKVRYYDPLRTSALHDRVDLMARWLHELHCRSPDHFACDV